TYNIKPVVTIRHFACPIHLIGRYRGWSSRRMIEHYKKLCKTLFTGYNELVNYWCTDNGINMILHSPFMITGVLLERIEHNEKIKRQAAHLELLASAKATKIAKEIDGIIKLVVYS